MLTLCHASACAGELAVRDFSFEGILGSQGTGIERVEKNHFKVTLGHAPEHTDWNNKLQFTIRRNAKGNSLRLDVVFNGGDAYIFNEYFHSWSYDGKNWTPIQWERHSKDSKLGDSLLFPEFTQDTVYVGHQVPMSYEDMVELTRQWERSSFVTVRTLGQSLGKRNLYRLTVTDPESPVAESRRWVHYFSNQHPGEHNSQWRMAGAIDWLLSDEAADARRRSINHFVLMMSPDAPSQGWYRVNAQGVDMNRSYFPGGSDPEKQAHEAYIYQKDLEALMRSDMPVTDLWSMHTWGGIVEPICVPGPEMGTVTGSWTDLKNLIERHDSRNLIKPLSIGDASQLPNSWNSGPHLQFGITTFLCEGGGGLYTKQEHLDSGVVLIRGLMDYYKGTKP